MMTREEFECLLSEDCLHCRFARKRFAEGLFEGIETIDTDEQTRKQIRGVIEGELCYENGDI